MAAFTFPQIATSFGTLTARPWAFLVVLTFGGFWYIFDRETLDLHGVVSLIVWAMTLFIQRAEHRDTQAIHAKLDELLKVQGGGSENLIDVDEEEAEEIESHRSDQNR